MSKKLTIVQIGGGWPPNIGNAFIDFGSIYILRQASIDSNVHICSTFPKSFLSRGGLSNPERLLDACLFDNIKNNFDIRNFIEADYIILSGAILNDLWIKNGFFDKLLERDKKIKIIINGGSGSLYTENEIETVRTFLKNIHPFAFISRDEIAFKEYKGIAEHSYSGIDCGFFISDYIRPLSMNLPNYVTLTFDGIPEPKFQGEKRFIIRTHHSPWSQSGGILKYIYYRNKQNFKKKNTVISDLPEDYLTIYANTDETHSDRVHACVPTLAFGKPARFYGKTPRAALFERIDAESIKDKLIAPDLNKIDVEKKRHIQFLSEILR